MTSAQTGPKPKKATPKPASNPLLSAFAGPFGLAPFAQIVPGDYTSAFKTAMAEHKAEIKAIAGNPAVPTFANTIEAMERAGRTLDRVCGVFYNVKGADTNPALQKIERAMAPKLSAHTSAINLDAKLYKRVASLYEHRESLGLDAEQARLLERHHTWLVRAGARLAPADKKRIAAIANRLAQLTTQFSQNVLADEQSWRLVLDEERDLDGLSPAQIQAAQRAATDAGLAGKYAITLARSSVEGFLQSATRRDLREDRVQGMGVRRGERWAEKTDNRAHRRRDRLALRFRARPVCIGYDTFAAYAARRHHGQDARGRARAARPGLARLPSRNRRPRNATSLQDDGRQGRRQHHHRSRGTGGTMPRRCVMAELRPSTSAQMQASTSSPGEP